MLKETLMQKGGIVTQAIAQDFIGMDVDDRVPTVEELAVRYEAARGTVQQAITKLKEYGAIRLEPHGHLGTFISEINYSKLMEICGAGNLVGVMPLPYSRRYEGLATGIYATLNHETGANVNLAFMGGSDRRVQALLDGRYNFAVMSLPTAQHYLENNYAIEISQVLGVHTYVQAHALIMRSDFKGELKRIGVDNTSFDQISMTAKYFQNQAIELVPLKYAHIIDNIKSRMIDGAIWSLEESIVNDTELCYQSIGAQGHENNTRAAIVVAQGDVTVRNFLKRFFNEKNVQSTQQAVLKNEILPNY
ncbi:MAG: GntR family transcriptional regulator YhfZ [Oscillospiraceae bacterium]